MERNNYYGDRELFVPPKIYCRPLRQFVEMGRCENLRCESKNRCLNLIIHESDVKRNIVERKVSLTL